MRIGAGVLPGGDALFWGRLIWVGLLGEALVTLLLSSGRGADGGAITGGCEVSAVSVSCAAAGVWRPVPFALVSGGRFVAVAAAGDAAGISVAVSFNTGAS